MSRSRGTGFITRLLDAVIIVGVRPGLDLMKLGCPTSVIGLLLEECTSEPVISRYQMFPPKPPLWSEFRRFLFRTIYSLPILQQPPKPSNLSLLADRCSSMHQLKQLHAKMIVTSRIRDNYAASRLLAFCALSETGNLNYAMKLFHHIQEPNSFMWNTVIRAHANGKVPQEALFLYVKMRRLRAVPGKHTFPFVLKACSNLKSLESCKQVHANVLAYGFDLDLHVVNGMIRCYSVSGRLDDARKLFDEISDRSLTIWTTMICGYAQNDSDTLSIELFRRMISDGLEPSGVTLSSVLSACAQSGCLELGKQIHHYIQEKGVEVGVILGTALVDMYARNGAIVQARKCFAGMKERNVATWNAMICGLAAHGHAEEAVHFFKNLEEERVRPSDITFVGVLSACCHAGLLDFGQKIFHSMRIVYNIEPKLQHYSCMVDLLGRCGKLLDAEVLIKGMKWKADIVIWGALLNACKNYVNIEVAERVGKEILALDPSYHGVYVVLSNMYAEAGRWEDVLKLRKIMKRESLKKNPGWSHFDDAS